MGEAGEGHGCGVAPGTAAGAFLGVVEMRRAVRPEEDPGIAGGRRFDERVPVGCALGNRQTVVMGADAACEDVVPVDDQVMHGDRRGEVLGLPYVADPVRCGDMFERDAKLRQTRAEGG